MKKLIIALIFAQASWLSALSLPNWLNVDNLRKAEETVVRNAAQGAQYGSEGLLSTSTKLNSFADFIKNKATEKQIKIGAAATAIISLYVLYKFFSKDTYSRNRNRGSEPAHVSCSKG